jgi:hypothetical protein
MKNQTKRFYWATENTVLATLWTIPVLIEAYCVLRKFPRPATPSYSHSPEDLENKRQLPSIFLEEVQNCYYNV